MLYYNILDNVLDHPPANSAPTPPDHAACGTGSCDHSHRPAVPAAHEGLHYHGKTPCGHAHPPKAASLAAYEAGHIPKGKSGAGWIAVALAGTALGAYLLSNYRKINPEKSAAASDYEAQKTSEERSEDIAYTINHALACTATDFIDPFVGNWTQQWLGKRISIGCGHDHSKDGDHGHGHHHHDHDHAHDHAPKSHLKHWWIGEVAGDFGAVPVTVAFQRYAPGFMDGLRQVMEPVMGPLFRYGAQRSARGWAREQGIDIDSDACREKENQIYAHEVRHLPQALIWTVSSVAINLATQRALGNKAPLWQLAAGKASGAAISAGLVVGGRALVPEAAHDWDRFTSRNIFLPATKAVGKVVGVNEEHVDNMARSHPHDGTGHWTARIEGESHAHDISATTGK